MMNVAKRRKKHLSTIQTARSLAGLFILTGFLLLISSIAIGTLLYQTDIRGNSVENILDTVNLTPNSTESQSLTASEDVTTESSLGVTSGGLTAKQQLRIFIASLDWNKIWKLLGTSFLILWLGYTLRVLAVLSETQLVDFQLDMGD